MNPALHNKWAGQEKKEGREERVILTRNHRLPQGSRVTVIVLETEKIKEQVKEALKRLKIEPNSDIIFSRCIVCNEELTAIAKEKMKLRGL